MREQIYCQSVSVSSTGEDQHVISTVQDSSDGPTALLHINKFKNQSVNGNEVENEESISDADLENIVGVVDSSELAVLSILRISFLWSWNLQAMK